MSAPTPISAPAAPTSAPSREGTGCLIPLVYADLFHFPLTASEIRRLASLPLEVEDIEAILAGEMASLLSREDEHYALRESASGLDERRARSAGVEAAWRKARTRARLMGLCPFVRGVLVTGSLSHDNFPPDADIDYLVLVAPRRLFTVFAVLGTVQRLTSVQTLCPNYYLSMDHLHLPERDYFVAREVLAAAPVLGGEACALFQAENRWAFDRFPNASPRATDVPRAGGTLQRLVEAVLGGRIGDALERLLTRLLASRIHAHYALCGVPVDEKVVAEALSEVRLRFHARLHRERIQALFLQKLRALGVEDAEAFLGNGARP